MEETTMMKAKLMIEMNLKSIPQKYTMFHHLLMNKRYQGHQQDLCVYHCEGL